ncbi:hypothetical protein GALL_319880 [mine drainage metagenome]|uniref:Uncharacterized protein n=1 Tax=mine drainage metagenome TaxID=410659 RepID=A0A1J5R2H8_9ZZZZ
MQRHADTGHTFEREITEPPADEKGPGRRRRRWAARSFTRSYRCRGGDARPVTPPIAHLPRSSARPGTALLFSGRRSLVDDGERDREMALRQIRSRHPLVFLSRSYWLVVREEITECAEPFVLPPRRKASI